MGEQDKRLAADIVFTKALIEACERVLDLYRLRLNELQKEVGNGEKEQDKERIMA